MGEAVKAVVDSRMLMAFDTYDVSRLGVNNSSEFVEREFDIVSSVIDRGLTYKTAYYQVIQVTVEYVGLVIKFNECVDAYRKLHKVTNASFKNANTSLSYFKLRLPLHR